MDQPRLILFWKPSITPLQAFCFTLLDRFSDSSHLHARDIWLNDVSRPDDSEDIILLYELPEALKLLRGLCLDKLTIFGPASHYSYETVNRLIKYSNGWRELRYVSPDYSIFFYDVIGRGRSYISDENYQPTHWNECFESARRDKLTVFRLSLPV